MTLCTCTAIRTSQTITSTGGDALDSDFPASAAMSHNGASTCDTTSTATSVSYNTTCGECNTRYCLCLGTDTCMRAVPAYARTVSGYIGYWGVFGDKFKCSYKRRLSRDSESQQWLDLHESEFELGPLQPTIGGIGNGRMHPRSGDTPHLV